MCVGIVRGKGLPSQYFRLSEQQAGGLCAAKNPSLNSKCIGRCVANGMFKPFGGSFVRAACPRGNTQEDGSRGG